MGTGKHADLVYIIDFGLSKEFRNPNTCAHIPYSCGRGFTGTAAFTSINSHLGLELGRRDDLESLAYILIYFLHGFLPWQETKKDIHTLKQEITSHDIFHELPVEFQTFLEACRSLGFHNRPNYDQYYNLFHDLLLWREFESNLVFDWDIPLMASL
jgi:serine/threonine protein kinase